MRAIRTQYFVTYPSNLISSDNYGENNSVFQVIPSFYGVLLLRGPESKEEVTQKVDEFTKNITEYANDLANRGTKFYAGKEYQ